MSFPQRPPIVSARASRARVARAIRRTGRASPAERARIAGYAKVGETIAGCAHRKRVLYSIRSALILLAGFGVGACADESPAADTARPDDRPEILAWAESPELPPLVVHPSGRYLSTSDGKPFFLMGDSAWPMAWKLSRSEIAEYLARRRSEGFNAIVTRAACSRNTVPNAYGARAYSVNADDEFDFTNPLTTPGNDPADPGAYDYWDHMEYIVQRAALEEMYVFLSPVHGRFVSGPWSENSTEGIVLDANSAYATANWVATRLGHYPHIVWVVGQDRSPSTPFGEFTEVYDALAEGIADGVNGISSYDGQADYSTTLMTYSPRKYRANSSFWFHAREWLDFNSIQDMPKDQLNAIRGDRRLVPPKPTFLYEGRYEGYTPAWTDYQVRVQAYQTVFAGGFGHFYGHETTQIFGYDWQRRNGDRRLWDESMNSLGAAQMRHLRWLMSTLTEDQYFERVQRQGLLLNAAGSSQDLESDVIVVTGDPDGSFLWAYTAAGRPIELDMTKLTGFEYFLYWFDPRTGQLTEGVAIQSGPSRLSRSFTPPATGPTGKDDWVLILTSNRSEALDNARQSSAFSSD